MRTAGFWLAAAILVAVVAIVTRVLAWALYLLAGLLLLAALVAAWRHWRRGRATNDLSHR